MIDWGRVQALWDELGEEDFHPVVELFLDEVESTAMRLCPKDPERLETDLNFLMGSAANLGFHRLVELCHGAEHALRDRGPGSVDVSGLLECYAASKREFVTRNQMQQSGAA